MMVPEIQHKNMMIADWDNTLIPTSIIQDIIRDSGGLDDAHKQYLAKIEFNILRIINYVLNQDCEVCIMSFYNKQEILTQAKKYYKAFYKFLKTTQ